MTQKNGDTVPDGDTNMAQLKEPKGYLVPVGYQELTGKSVDLIEVLNLDERGRTTREPVGVPLLTAVRDKIRGGRRGPALKPASAL